MFAQIPPSRLLLYCVLFGAILLAYPLISFIWVKDSVAQLEGEIDSIRSTALARSRKQAANLAAREHYRDADHFYVDKSLESLTFLNPEVEALKKILETPDYANDERLRKRYEFLISGENALQFSEGIVQSTPLFQEVTETMMHPVELDQKDLSLLLKRIERENPAEGAVQVQRPQLLISEFRLDRKNIYGNDVFLLNMKLIKREFSP